MNIIHARLGSGPSAWNRCAALFIVIAGFGLTLMYADIDISFSSTFDAVNQKSDGAAMDSSFTFQLGSFDSSFTPTAGNTDQWMSHWVMAPGADSSGASASYSDTPVNPLIAPNTGAVSSFTGGARLADNSGPFGTSDQAYIWGFDDRHGSGTGEWVLITNDAWNYPQVVDGVQFPEAFQTSDIGTYAVLGSVNPLYSGGSDPPHLVSEGVILVPVPEPSVAILLLGGIGLVVLRRRR